MNAVLRGWQQVRKEGMLGKDHKAQVMIESERRVLKVCLHNVKHEMVSRE